jgi:hypothetical protein
MAFADPTPVTLQAVVHNLVRIDSAKGQSEYSYTSATERVTAVIRNTSGKPDADGRVKERHTISLRQTIFATSTVPEYVRQASMTIENYFGDDVTAYDDVAIAVAALITAGNVAKLSNFES